jgi:NAD(P)-dependent dehydrogenase (short-subunit alcohol dehydrogenase family)
MLAHRHGSAVSVGLRHQACAGWHLDSTAVLSKIFWKFYRFLDDGASARNRTAGENKTGENADMSTGKRAVVTGGANGIGQAFCKRLAAQGANIVIADIADCSETVGAIKKSGGAAIAVRCDQTSEADVAKLRAAVETALGGCDILVHCAGIYPTAAIDEITFAQWRKVLSVNLDSVFLLVKAFLPAMKEQRWGRIISVSSTTFHSGIGFNTHYTASKGGLIGFARSLASEVGDFGITVNTIAPGLTRTDTTVNGKPGEFGWFDMIREQQAIKRTETPEDLTGTLAFLASEDAAFITGQTIVVDGGWRFS